jgi:hypothetical protein
MTFGAQYEADPTEKLAALDAGVAPASDVDVSQLQTNYWQCLKESKRQRYVHCRRQL